MKRAIPTGMFLLVVVGLLVITACKPVNPNEKHINQASKPVDPNEEYISQAVKGAKILRAESDSSFELVNVWLVDNLNGRGGHGQQFDVCLAYNYRNSRMDVVVLPKGVIGGRVVTGSDVNKRLTFNEDLWNNTCRGQIARVYISGEVEQRLGVDESAGQRDIARTEDPKHAFVVIDTVKVRKDPKGGWFGPKLHDVYMAGQDTPVVFCESGPSFPTGKPVTVFYNEVRSKPDSSGCKAAVAVVEGEAVWKDGKPVTFAELAKMREQEEHFHDEAFVPPWTRLSFAWRKPKPIGDPCPDTSGAPIDIIRRYKGQKCSIAVVCDHGYVLFVNWKVVGLDDSTGTDKVGWAPWARDVVETIIAEYGSKYVGQEQQYRQSMLDTVTALQLKSITDVLQRPYTPLPEVPIPEQLWKDLGITPTNEVRKESANALRLSDGQLPELLVENPDPGVCGSGSGCPWSIYGLRGGVTRDGKVSLKYKTLLESQGGAVYVLDKLDNGYRGLLIDGGYGGSILRFNGTSYEVTKCFSHDYKELDDIHLADCQ